MTDTELPDPPSKDLVVVGRPWRPPAVVDVGIEVAATVTRGVVAVTRTGLHLAAPFARFVIRPPVVAEKHWPQSRFLALADRGRQRRERGEAQVAAQLQVVLPAVVSAVLDWIDLTALVEKVIAAVDIDGIVDSVDIPRIIDRVDINGIVSDLDLDAIVASVDIEKIIDSVDINGVVSKVDIGAIIQGLDIDSIAREVIVNINLPEIIRESSGAMASETVVGVRMRGIEADERVSRIVDRVMLRRRGRDAPASALGRGPDDDG